MVPSRQVTGRRASTVVKDFKLIGGGTPSASRGRRRDRPPVPSGHAGGPGAFHVGSVVKTTVSGDVEQPPLLQALAEGLGRPIASIRDDDPARQQPLATKWVVPTAS